MPSTWLRTQARRLLPGCGAFAACAAAAVVVSAPIAMERAVEHVRFADRLGTLPVEVGLCHNGRSTLDTGLLGKVFWQQTGAFGFGACARATGPPEAGGTLASYVDPAFIRANVALIDDPRAVVDAYSEEFSDRLRDRFLVEELVAVVVGGSLLFVVVPRRHLHGPAARREVVIALVLVAGATTVSTVVADRLFHQWSGSQPVGPVYHMPGVARLGFGTPQALEVARQVEPFIDKNRARTQQAADDYEATARRTLATQLRLRAADLAPRHGEMIVAAEADTQGSYVGIHVRTTLYTQLVDVLGPDALALRTIAGDVTSNGTVAEAGYVEREATVSGPVATAAVGGDHDSEDTWGQLADAGLVVPDLGTADTADTAGLRVSGANDREHKTLFGGLVTNREGLSETELGARLRAAVDPDRPGIVLLHQPEAAAGYLGLPTVEMLRVATGSLTHPHDDAVPDQPPGIVDIGHLHHADGPWVLWNTDGPQVTWTVVDQLGTAGGVENAPTFNRFSTPTSVPLEPLMVRLQFVNTNSGLETGYATVSCDLSGTCTISGRTDVGLPGGLPG